MSTDSTKAPRTTKPPTSSTPERFLPNGTGLVNLAYSPAPSSFPSSTAIFRSATLNRFDLPIDWGWFSFLTKPMFAALDAVLRVVGSFGVAILLLAVAIKDERRAAANACDPRALSQ